MIRRVRKEETMKSPKQQINVRKQNEVRNGVKFFFLFILLVTIYFVAYESTKKKNRLDFESQAIGVVIANDDTVSKGFEPQASGVVTQDLRISIRPRLASGANTNR